MLRNWQCHYFLWLLFVPSAFGQSPEVTKIEPPNWWVGHSINPVRVLIRGRNFKDARVEAGSSDIHVGPAQVNGTGTYLFVDVHLDPEGKPGKKILIIRTSAGTAEAPFDFLVPSPRSGRFLGFSPDDLIYLIMTDRFADGDVTNDDPQISKGLFNRNESRYYHGGDFQGIIDHLPYLKDLGVTAIWITPVYDNVNHLNDRERYDNKPITDYHGYGAVDFYGVEEHFGTMAKLRELVDTAHEQGIKVIQDQVANHTGPFHPWVTDPPTPTWFNGTESNHVANTWQTWTLIDPHATAESRKGTLDGWFIDILPDLNQNDQEVERYLIQNTLWWIGMTGFDGIREDTLPYVPRGFWHKWQAAIKREYPDLRVVGEIYDGDPALVSFFQGGSARFDGTDSGIDTVFDFPLLYPMRRAYAGGEPVREVAAMLARDWLYPDPASLVTFLGNHDMPRFMNERGADYGGLRLAFAQLLTTRGIPMIYYGDEIGMPGAGDPDNRRDFPGGWQGDSRNAFTQAGRTADEQELFDHARRLARLRASLAPLRRGRQVDLSVGEHIYAFARVTPDSQVIVVVNNSTQAAEANIPTGQLRLTEGELLQDRLGVIQETRVTDHRIRVRLPARAAAILR